MAYNPAAAGSISIQEVDGAPALTGITSLAVTNGSLSSSTGTANQAVIVTGAGSTAGTPHNALAQAGANIGSTANFATTSSTFVDVTNVTVTDTFHGGRALYLFDCTVTNSSTASVGFDFNVDGSRIGDATEGYRRCTIPAANTVIPFSMMYLTTGALSTGSHTIKVQVKASTGTTTIVTSDVDANLAVLEWPTQGVTT